MMFKDKDVDQLVSVSESQCESEFGYVHTESLYDQFGFIARIRFFFFFCLVVHIIFEMWPISH